MTRYRLWKLRRRLRGRARVLALLANYELPEGRKLPNLEQALYETLCRDHAVKP